MNLDQTKEILNKHYYFKIDEGYLKLIGNITVRQLYEATADTWHYHLKDISFEKVKRNIAACIDLDKNWMINIAEVINGPLEMTNN